MVYAPSAIASIYARARYDAIMAANDPKRNGLLALEFQSTVFAVVRELSASSDVRINWVFDPLSSPGFYQGLDLSCVKDGWEVLGAVAQPEGFVWLVAAGSPGVSFGGWICFFEFGYEKDDHGYLQEWVPVGEGSIIRSVHPEECGTDLLADMLARKLAAMSVERDLANR
jgi:hypothetical protein